jgi:large subunit ribosomal protein L9
MNVILLEEVDNLGEKGEMVSVKPGYGRNYLIPRGLAKIATKGAVRASEEEYKQAARKRNARKDQAVQMGRQLETVTVEVPMRIGEGGRIFGSVTTQMVADLLEAQGFELDRRRISISEDIKTIGEYTGSVRVHPEVTAEFKINVTPDIVPGA